jgi:hypothetical protein
MRTFGSLGVAVLLAGTLVASACGGGGARKVVVDENVCAGSVRFLRMKLGQTNRVILDNTQHSEEQASITLNLDRFPVLVRGEIPQGSVIGSPLSTIRVTADAGNQTSVDLEPTYTGTYEATCNVRLADPGGQRIVQSTVEFQLVE